MTRAAGMVHFLLQDRFPISAVAQGGVFRWNDGRENPDAFHALLEYPRFVVSYLTSLANDSDSFYPDHGRSRDPHQHRRTRQPTVEGG
jgi:hypothetical protein